MSTRIPTDGPDTALFQIARNLRLRYSHAFVVQAVSAHPRPNTLLALVEIARRMGLKPSPVQADASGLSAVRVPAVVHFSGRNGDGGFAVLESVSDDEVRLWDSLSGRRTWKRDVFIGRWSGVVVMFERAGEPGAPERHYLRQRFLEIVAGGTSTPAVADGRASPALRAGFVALISALLVAVLAGTLGSDRVPAGVLIALTLVGLGVTVVMGISTSDQQNGFASRVCRRGRIVDCHGVLTSRYSRLFGLPLSDIGTAFYGAIMLLVVSSARSTPAEVWQMVTLLFTAALPPALLLVTLQISMRQLCTLCMVTHMVNVSGALIGWWFLWDGGLARRSLYLGLLFVLFFMLVLFIVVPYFRRSASLSFISDRHRRIAASPFGSLAQLLTEPPTAVDGPSTAVPVEGSAGEHEVVIFVHPGCGKCLPVLRELLALMQSIPMNVFVGVAPKDATEADRHASSVLVATWMAVPSDGIVDGYSAAKKLLGRLSGGDAAIVLAAELGVDRNEVERWVLPARSLVERAERAVDEHADGTPAIFVDSRPFTAPLGHLAYLIEKHPDLVRLT